MITRRWRKAGRWAVLGALVLGAAVVPSVAQADSPVLPGNEGDIGVYTNGLNHTMEIGDPVYNNVAEVAERDSTVRWLHEVV